MKSYKELIQEIWKLNRVHVSDDMDLALKRTSEFYEGSRLISYPCGTAIGGGGSWTIPDRWIVKKGVLRDLKGKVVCSFNETPLRLFAYSPSYSGEISREDLINDHVFSMPSRPKAIPFHFRNQYRPWNRIWGFCLCDEEVKNLKEDRYYVEIETEFVSDNMTQLEYTHHGETSKRFMFVGHFDHPAQCNDGLTGCIVANEVIRRLKGQKTHYTYASFNSVEIVGSVAYCHFEKKLIQDTLGALFVAMSSSDAPLSFQYSGSPETFIIDRAMRHLLDIRYPGTVMKPFRELLGNDEVAFEAPGVNVKCSSIMRLPFDRYHSSDDNYNGISFEKLEEKIDLICDLIDILENNFIVRPSFHGLPCFSNPKFDLYLNPSSMSSTQQKVIVANEFLEGLRDSELSSLSSNYDRLNHFMNQLVSVFSDYEDKQLDVLGLAERFNLPFRFVLNYLRRWEKLELLEFGPHASV